MRRIFGSIGTSVVIAALLTIGVTSPVAADEVAGSGEIELLVKVGSELVAVPDAELEQYKLDLEPTEAADSQKQETEPPTTDLISFDQYVRCFAQNMEHEIFANYVWYWDGVGRSINLKCGWNNLDAGSGYKHIRYSHEADWQAKLNAARSAGWNTPFANTASWDDLMSVATAEAISYPIYVGGSAVNKTTCTVVTLYFGDPTTGNIVYEFNARVAFATDSDRLITSLPTSGTTCK
jgi:hypothetical protein